MSKHRMITTLPFGSREFDIEITFTVVPGRPETPPAYAHGGLPAEAAEVEFVSARVDDDGYLLPSQADVYAKATDYLASDDGYQHAMDIADAEYAAAAADAADMRREERMMECDQ